MSSPPVSALALSTGLRAFVDSVSLPLPKPLPLVHITDIAAAKSILKNGYLDVRNCRHFSDLLKRDEKLIYLSYGRPSYRGRTSEKVDTGWIRKPVAFVFKPESVGSVVARVFPFDTGAYFLNKLETWIDIEAMPIAEFELAGTIDSARKIVKKFYKTNPKYFALQPARRMSYDKINFEIDGLWNMINAKGKDKADDRRKTIEIQLQSRLEISASNVIAVVAPDETLQSPQFLNWVGILGLAPICYPENGSIRSREGWDASLHDKTLEFLRGLV